jgi:hypothetical protein
VIKGTTYLRLEIPRYFTKLIFGGLVTSLPLVPVHINRQEVHKSNSTPNMRTNNVTIYSTCCYEIAGSRTTTIEVVVEKIQFSEVLCV